MSVPADVRAYVAEHDLTARSPWRATARTGVVAALFAGLAAAGMAASHAAVWAVVWLAQGAVLVGSYSAMHEAAHGTLYRSRRVNRFVGVVWAATIGVNWSLWRSYHLEHHARLGGADDPELQKVFVISRRRHYLLFPAGGLLFVIQLWMESLGTLAGRYPSYVRTRTGRRAIQVDAAVLVALTAALLAGLVLAPGSTLRLVVAPFLVAVAVFLPLTAVNEHYECAKRGEVFDMTRTVVSNRVFRFLVWNSNFHTGHHLVPAVPFHHAPELHRYIESRTTHLAPSYTAFHLDVLRRCGAAEAVTDVREVDELVLSPAGESVWARPSR